MEHGRKQFLVWLPALLIACLIFYFSAQPADISTEMSDGVSRLLLSIGRLFGFFEGPEENYYEIIERMSFPVRKGAHVTEYLCLYFAVLFALHRWDVRGKRLFWTAFAMTMAYACTDEFHQLFVPGRSPMCWWTAAGPLSCRFSLPGGSGRKKLPASEFRRPAFSFGQTRETAF